MSLHGICCRLPVLPFKLIQARLNNGRIISGNCRTAIIYSRNGRRPIETAIDLSFNDHRNAFKGKTTLEIVRAALVLQMCSVDFFVVHNYKILQLFQKYTPRLLFSALVRPTFYDQFVASRDFLPDYAARLRTAGILPLLAVSMEESDGKNYDSKRTLSERNIEVLVDCVQLTSNLKADYPMMQLKMTAFVSTELLIKISQLVEDNKITAHTLHKQMIKPGSQLISAYLSDSENADLSFALDQLNKIGKVSLDKNVKILVDAEYTYINPGLRLLSKAMILRFNQSKPHVWYTYQCYLKDTKRILEEDIEFTKSSAVCFGAKVVRGAYIASETNRAKELGIPSPIWDSYEDTNINYDECVALILENVKENTDKFAMIIATHNENSVRNAITRLQELGINENSSQVFFGQLMGMCDQVTYTLGKSGYKVAKSIPYGELEDVLPYLSRRVTENTSIFQNVRKEKHLLWKELQSRFMPWN